MPEEPIVEGNEGNGSEKFTAEEWGKRFNEGEWRTTLPEELSTNASMAKFNGKSPADVVKSYIELEKAFGSKIPPMPNTNKKEDWDEWNSKYNRGYPKDSKEYQFHKPEGDYPYDTEGEEFFRKLAYDNGLTRAQAENVWKQGALRSYESWKEATAAQAALKEKDKIELKKEWGAAYDENMSRARSVLQKFGTPELIGRMKNNVSSDVWKFLANVADNFNEDQLPESKPRVSLSPEEAVSKAKALVQDNMDVFMNKRHPRHMELMAEKDRLYKMAYQSK